MSTRPRTRAWPRKRPPTPWPWSCSAAGKGEAAAASDTQGPPPGLRSPDPVAHAPGRPRREARRGSSWSSGTARTTSATPSALGHEAEPIFVEQAEQLGTGHAVLRRRTRSARPPTSSWRTATSTRSTRGPPAAPLSRRTGGRLVTSAHDRRPGGYGRVVRDGRRVSTCDRGPTRRPPILDPRGRDELDRVPARPPVRDLAAPRSGEPSARVLPEPGDLRSSSTRASASTPSSATPGASSAPTHAPGSPGSRVVRRAARTSRTWPPASADRSGRHLHRRRGADRPDTVVHPNTFLEGCRIGKRVRLGPSARSPARGSGTARSSGSRSSRTPGSARLRGGSVRAAPPRRRP